MLYIPYMLKNEPWATTRILFRVLGHSSKLSHNMKLLCMHWIDRASYVKWTGVCLIPPQVQTVAHGLFLKYFCQHWATVWGWATVCSWAHSSAYTVVVSWIWFTYSCNELLVHFILVFFWFFNWNQLLWFSGFSLSVLHLEIWDRLLILEKVRSHNFKKFLEDRKNCRASCVLRP